MFDHGAYPRLVQGHIVQYTAIDDEVVKHFPHICPGAGCAIARWLREHGQRERYYTLQETA